MPANEDTSNDTTLVRTEQGEAGPPAGSWRKMSGERPRMDSSSTLNLSGLANGVEERSSAEKRDFRSMPRRDVHEKLFRDFFELVLQRAVFQVSLKLRESIYIYLFVDLNAIIPIEWDNTQ